MPEKELYGKTHNMTNLRIIKDPNVVGRYDVYADGHKLQGVRSVDVHFYPQEVMTADISLMSVSKIDHDLFATMHFEPTDIRECIRFLMLNIQLDNDFREAWVLSIKSALDDMNRSGKDMDNYEKAGYILNRIME